MLSDLTYKVVSFEYLEQVDSNEAIDWAYEMLELGNETPALLMLAAFDKPTNSFEVLPYLTDALNELGLESKTGEPAILSYAGYFVKKISKGENIKSLLTELYNFCKEQNYESSIYDFYLLYWAWADIEYDNTYPNHYWPEANKENIRDIVISEAKNWIAKNEENYLQQDV